MRFNTDVQYKTHSVKRINFYKYICFEKQYMEMVISHVFEIYSLAYILFFKFTLNIYILMLFRFIKHLLFYCSTLNFLLYKFENTKSIAWDYLLSFIHETVNFLFAYLFIFENPALFWLITRYIAEVQYKKDIPKQTNIRIYVSADEVYESIYSVTS